MDNFDVFKDRVESLLERWDRDDVGSPGQRIKACLAEINDDFTQALIGGEDSNERT